MANQPLFYSPTPLTPLPFMFDSMLSSPFSQLLLWFNAALRLKKCRLQDFQSQLEQRFSSGLFDDVCPSMRRGNAL